MRSSARFPPDLDACEAVELELESGEWVVRCRTTSGLPIDDLPRRLDRLTEHRVDPSGHREALHPEEERALGEQRDLPGEAAGEEGLPQPVDLARLVRQLFGGEVRRVIELQELSLSR